MLPSSNSDGAQKNDEKQKLNKVFYKHLRESSGAPSIDEEDAPKDKHKLAYFIMLLLGVGFLLPYQAFITAVDYFTFLYPTRKVEYTFPAVYMVSLFITMMLLVKYCKNVSFNFRILGGFAVFLILIIAIPFLDLLFLGSGDINGDDIEGDATTVMFWIMVILLLLTGVMDAIIQGSAYGVAAFFPPEYAQAVQSGNAVAGLAVCILRIITKASFPLDVNGLRKSAMVYFVISAFVIIMCIASYLVFIRLPFTIYNLAKNNPKGVSELLSDTDNDTDISETRKFWESFKPVLLKIWRYGACAAFVFCVTLLAFPGMVLNIDTEVLAADWFPIIVITDFNVFDLVGKSLPNIHKNNLESFPDMFLYAGVLLRVIMIPLFIMCMYLEPFRHIAWPLVFVGIFALTNGYFGSIVMMIGPSKVENSEKEVAGTFMAFSVIIGLTVGAILSWISQLFITW